MPAAQRTPQPPQAQRQEPDERRAAAQVGPVLALAPDTPAEGERQRALAAAAVRESALAHEQFAEAELAEDSHDGHGQSDHADDEELARAVANMHVLWAMAHQASGRLIEARAGGSSAIDEELEADAAAERARAAEAGVEAAEHRADARQDEQPGPSASEQAAEAEQAEHLADEERIRARVARHRDRDRGLRRLQPGPGRLLGGSPAISAAAPAVPELLDHEIQAITRVLNERGPTRRPEIARLAGARYWGPGVFRRALAEAISGGLVRRVGRDTYAARVPGDDQPAETGR